MTFDEWYEANGRHLATKRACELIWKSAEKTRDAVWEAEIESHVSAAVANERQAAKRSGQSSGDPIVDAVREKLRQRSIVGQTKYGVTLAQAGLTRLQALRHAQEEALDLANYLEIEIQREELQAMSDGFSR